MSGKGRGPNQLEALFRVGVSLKCWGYERL